MPDAITVLTTDHRTVQTLFSQVEGKASPEAEVVDKIVKELSIHDAIEKQYLYPLVRDKVSGGNGMADHSIEEHDKVAETLLAIDKAERASAEQAQLLTELIRMVTSHIREEEQDIFPAMRTSMGQTELDELGSTLEGAKKTAPTRPHPHAPSEGLGTKLAGAVSAPLDKARDAASGRS
jgi:hemerythrin superfamily protein